LIHGIHHSTLSDPNKPKEDPNALPKIVPANIDKGGFRDGKAPETIQSRVNSPKSTVPVYGIPDKH
jgi:hypothetical protein